MKIAGKGVKFKDVMLVSDSSKIASQIQIDYRRTKSMDIRTYVKVKKLPGGTMDDCDIVNGEVFTGRVMRVGMRLNIAKPRMLLIRDNLSFPRSDKLVSMDNLAAQQEEYVKNVVAKLMMFEPDVILAENVVCQGVIDALHEANITLILRVKPQVLERLVRLFQLTIITSLDSTLEVPAGECCVRFSSRSVVTKNGAKTPLITLERSDLSNGCTVLLRGGEQKELAKVKRVILRMLLLKSNARYERAFLLTEYAQAAHFDPDFKQFQGYKLKELTLSPFVKIKDGHPNEESSDSEASVFLYRFLLLQ